MLLARHWRSCPSPCKRPVHNSMDVNGGAASPNSANRAQRPRSKAARQQYHHVKEEPRCHTPPCHTLNLQAMS